MEQDEFIKNLQATFFDELSEVLLELEDIFLRIEKEGADPDIINKLFRLFHNIKGSSKAVEFLVLADFSHEIENLLLDIKTQKQVLNATILEGLLKSLDLIKVHVANLKRGKGDASDFKGHIEHIVGKAKTTPVNSENKGMTFFSEEEAKATKTPSKEVQASEQDMTLKVPLRRIDDILDYFGEQSIIISNLNLLLKESKKPNLDIIRKVTNDLKKMNDSLHESLMKIRTVSLSLFFRRMERVARDIAKFTGKKIDFRKNGEHHELDKSILDSLIDPMTHMVRNAVDHGIETSEERIAAQKKGEGTLYLSAQRVGGAFEIILEDDGKGLDREQILKKASKLNLIDPNKEFTDAEVFDLIFLHGFSTKDQANEISGRGVGMDVVREQLKKLKGAVQVSSKKGLGTRFVLRVPLSLSIFNGTVISICGQRFVIANTDYLEIIVLEKSEKRATELSPIYHHRGRVLHSVNLNVLFSFSSPGENFKDKEKMALVVNKDGRELGLLVEEVLGQEQVILKKLDTEVANIAYTCGGAILANGKVALILDVESIVNFFDGKNRKSA